jgi:hypothetical protein
MRLLSSPLHLVPSSSRPVPHASLETSSSVDLFVSDSTGDFIPDTANELAQISLCKGKALLSASSVSPYQVEDSELLDIPRHVLLPVNPRLQPHRVW